MSGKRYTEGFKVEAVKLVDARGHPAAELASRLGMTTISIGKSKVISIGLVRALF